VELKCATAVGITLCMLIVHSITHCCGTLAHSSYQGAFWLAVMQSKCCWLAVHVFLLLAVFSWVYELQCLICYLSVSSCVCSLQLHMHSGSSKSHQALCSCIQLLYSKLLVDHHLSVTRISSAVLRDDSMHLLLALHGAALV
jgi:hypothetical protein